MNILIPDSWLKEHLGTNATPKQIAECLSLCSQSVEKLTKVGKDWLYEVEITTNRSDCLSLYGIARELSAVLPRFNIQAQLKIIPEEKVKIPKLKRELPLEVKIQKTSLCPRFTALIFDQITIKPSPQVVRDRLEKSGIRALDNVVDISNYLMLELGQPMHTFDYDKIKGAKMILREAAGGEKITTLDGQIRPLPDGAIIIEDGKGRIVDLCGIMGGQNSEVDQDTERILLFVQTYDPMKIRQTCQKLSFRTEAASRFEKGIDPEGVILAMKKAVAMFRKNCRARVASNLIDIYPHPPKAQKVTLSQEKLDQLMGVKIKLPDAKKILDNLGFLSTINHQPSTITCSIPHWRQGDVAIPEDLVEEVARIYGYHHLPSNLPAGDLPQTGKDPRFLWEAKIKEALKFWGFTETVSYSMMGAYSLQKATIDPKECLKIANSLNEDLVYMRTSLIPSVLEAISENQAEFKKIRIFELANVYQPNNSHQLPDEAPFLTGVVNDADFYETKGIIEVLLTDLGITEIRFTPYQLKKTFYGRVFHPNRTAEIMAGNELLGIIGEIKPQILTQFEISDRVVVFDLEIDELVKQATDLKKYQPVSRYPAIIEDLSFTVQPKTQVGDLIQLIRELDPIIQSVELLDAYKDTRTFRIAYQSQKKTLTDKKVGEIRKKIIKKVKDKFRAHLKTLKT